MIDQAVCLKEDVGSGRGLAYRGPFTEAVELVIDSEPDLKAELRDLVLDRPDQSGAERSVEEHIRACCELHAGLDINANDMLTPLARDLLLHAFSSVDWRSLAGKLVERQTETRSGGRIELGPAQGRSLDLRSED